MYSHRMVVPQRDDSRVWKKETERKVAKSRTTHIILTLSEVVEERKHTHTHICALEYSSTRVLCSLVSLFSVYYYVRSSISNVYCICCNNCILLENSYASIVAYVRRVSFTYFYTSALVFNRRVVDFWGQESGI